MKQYLLIMSLVLLMLAYSYPGNGFFDDLLEQQRGGKTTTVPQEEEGKKRKGLIEGIGGILGAKEKDIDLIKKGVKTVQALQPIGEEEEIAIGQAVAVEAFSRFGGEYQNEGLVRYINLVGKTIAEVSDRPELSYHFAILNSEEHNAFAAPGGYILVTRGLLQSLTNEAELAGVLAHEIAHVAKKHMLKTIRRGAILANVSDFTFSAMKKNPKLFSNVIQEITDKLFDKGLDKDLEYEADVYGIDYAYRAGYHPGGLRDFLVSLQSKKGVAQSRLFTTHPSTSVRIRKCNETLKRFQDGDVFPYLAERFQRQMRSLQS